MHEKFYTEQNAFVSFQKGEEKGFAFYFNLYYKELIFFSTKLVKNSSIAEDITADSFIKLFEKRTTIQSENTIKGFLFTMVRNTCLDKIKQQKTRVVNHNQLSYLHDVNERTPIDEMIRTETLSILLKAVEELPKATQRVFKLFYFEGKKYNEISRELGRSKETIRKQKQHALTLLRKKFLGFFPVLFMKLLCVAGIIF